MYLRVHPSDNVAVVLRAIPEGSLIRMGHLQFSLPKAIEPKHKFSLTDLRPTDSVVMYGITIGKATQEIRQGEQLTIFNVKHDAEAFSAAARQPQTAWQPPDVSKFAGRRFEGFHRSDGSVGTANYWLVIPLVFCENNNILKLKEAFEKALGYGRPDTYLEQVQQLAQWAKEGNQAAVELFEPTPGQPQQANTGRFFKNIDGVKFITHEMGCGGSNADSLRLAELFASYALNPNVGGITILSLGCQKTQYQDMLESIHRRDPHFDKPLLYFNQQAYGTEHAMLSAAIKQTFLGLQKINEAVRKPAPLSELRIGLKCGGSDGFSGISANPVLGHLSDMVVALGGTTYLAEFPELCGVEQDLLNRCQTDAIADRFERLMRNYNHLAISHGEGFENNPSFGNIKDGLITDAMKSAGAAKKGGSAPVADVLNYAEISTKPGLQLVCTPGNDVLSTTGKTAAGATMILFTTGLGTPTGNPISAVVKVATNSALAKRMPDIIDFDCGSIISGEKTIEETAEELLEYCIELASGRFQTKAQLLGQDDFIPWRQGINL